MVEKYNSYRCIPCYKQHKTCDKLLPACKNCIRREVTCRYKKITVGFKIDDIFTNDKKNTKKSNSRNSTIVFTKPIVSNLIQLTKNVYKIFKKMSVMDSIIILIQYPDPFRAFDKLNLSSSSILALEKLLSKVYFPKDNSLNRISNSQPVSILLEEALSKYFKIVHVSFPIFLEQEFDFNSQSLILKSALLATGLVWMDRSELIQSLINNFSNMLEITFSKISKLKPTLDNLRAMVILLTGLSTLPWIRAIFDKMLGICYNYSFLLGLHLTNHSNNSIKRKERAMLYACIQYLYASIFPIVGSSMALPLKPKALKPLISHQKFTTLKLQKTKDTYALFRAAYMLDIASVFYSKRIAKEYHFKDIVDPKLLKHVELIFLKKLDSIKLNYTNQILTMKEIGKFNDNRFLDHALNYIKFMDHYIRHSYHSFVLQNGNKGRAINISPDIYHNAEMAIKHLASLPGRFALFSTVAGITHCIITLIKSNDPSFRPTIRKGIDYLTSLSETTPLHYLCLFYLKLIQLNQN